MPFVLRSTRVFKLKMNPAVAAFLKGKDVVGLKIPLMFGQGDRLWMVECGPAGRTGRADLCTVWGTSGNLLLLERRMGWGSHKLDDDLSELKLTVLPDVYTMIDESAIPEGSTT